MIAVSLNSKRGFVVISIKGSPSLDEYIQSSRAMATHDNFYPTMHRICDFSQIDDLAVSAQDVVAFSEEVRTNVPTAKTAKVALVAKDGRDRKMMELFSEQFDQERFRIYEQGRDAMAWVLWGEPVVPESKPTDRIKVHRLTGDVRALDIFQIQSSWFNDPQFEANMPVMWDLTDATMVGNADSRPVVVRGLVRKSKELRPEGRASVVTVDPESRAMLSSAFEEMTNSGHMKICGSAEEAQDWLLR